MIYSPSYEEGKCIVVQSNGVVREYQQMPTYNSDIEYRDYYTNMNYIYNTNTAHFSNYSTLPVCREGTNNIMYRVDINNIVPPIIIALILILTILLEYLRKVFR